MSETEAFLSRVLKMEGDCWQWTGSKVSPHKGGPVYGLFIFEKKRERAHRASLRLLKGISAGDGLVCHRCDNPLCVNPDHLYVGTHAENMQDMKDRKRGRGGTRGERNGLSKVTENIVRLIRASSEDAGTAARRYGLCRATIYHIRNRRIWRHVQ